MPRSLPSLLHQQTESACELSSASHSSLSGGNSFTPLSIIVILTRVFRKWEWATVTLYQSGTGEHLHHWRREEGNDQWWPAGVLSCYSIFASGCNVGLNFQIWNLAAAIMGALLVDKLGRRPLFLLSNTGMLLSHCFRVFAAAMC